MSVTSTTSSSCRGNTGGENSSRSYRLQRRENGACNYQTSYILETNIQKYTVRFTSPAATFPMLD